VSSRSLGDIGGRHHELRGRILGCGFSTGVRVVVGMWDTSPIGPFADVMWAERDGTRVLYAEERAERLVSAVYGFDRVVHDRVGATWDRRVLDVRFGDARLTFSVGRGVPFPPRPRWITRYVEAPIARRLLGVETYGVSPSGVREWYRARRFHRIRAVDTHGLALGVMGPVAPRCGFGFSEPPAMPSLTEVRPVLQDPTGRLDQVIGELRCAG
jgi:hypothetical protein